MYTSWFRYSLSRPYPFRWFTPVVIIGGIIFTALFSAINVATNGFVLQTIYTTDPNTTLTEKHWFTQAPWSWGAKIATTCQAQNIPIGSEFYTTNLGLSYTINSVSRWDAQTNQSVQYPALSYLNNTLQDCEIDSVVVNLRKADLTQNGYGAWWSWGDSTGTANAHCTIHSASGPVNVTFSTEYKSGAKSFNYMVSTNYTTSASLWWGSRLLNLYWYAILDQMATNAFYPAGNGTFASTPFWMKGAFTFSPNVTSDIRTYDYFDLKQYLIANDGSIKNLVYSDLQYMYNYDDFAYSAPLTESLAWAKVMSSTMMTDLGVSSNQNLLLDPDQLQWILQYPDDEVRLAMNNKSCDYTKSSSCTQDWGNFGAIAAPNKAPNINTNLQVPMNESYDEFRAMMGPLGTTDAQMFNQYACSVPVGKPGGTVFLSVLIADLVFLRVLWTLLGLTADMLVRRNQGAMLCEGHDGVPLVRMRDGIAEGHDDVTPHGPQEGTSFGKGFFSRGTTSYNPIGG